MLKREMEPFDYAKNSMTSNWMKDEICDSINYNEHHDSERKCNTIKLDVQQESNEGESIQKEGRNFCVNRGNGLRRVRVVEDIMENVNIKADMIKKETDGEELEVYIKREVTEEGEFVNCNFSEEDSKAKSELEEHTYSGQLSLFAGQEREDDAVESKKKKRHICTFCNKEFKLNSYLVKHLRIHTGENTLKCSNSTNLKSHLRSHTGEKPFKCEYCEYSTSHSSAMRRHLRKHTGEKPFKCEICEYRTPNKSNLTTHVRIHTGEKPFKCNLCEFSSSTSGALRRHIGRHTGMKTL
ncbi:hypothetical protein J437_LFUL015739 [Ladona fulva]|uniref:C2H2-type domain-containing protein n=1 Tax=Ladona fulva TaxID=123851 RepID=A0A8K0P4F1_LADFU|nr:hypothetical protein J437_LFUL015739 [Ladona fulva]